jgi:hypothetical protein
VRGSVRTSGRGDVNKRRWAPPWPVWSDRSALTPPLIRPSGTVSPAERRGLPAHSPNGVRSGRSLTMPTSTLCSYAHRVFRRRIAPFSPFVPPEAWARNNKTDPISRAPPVYRLSRSEPPEHERFRKRLQQASRSAAQCRCAARELCSGANIPDDLKSTNRALHPRPSQPEGALEMPPRIRIIKLFP